MQERNTTIILIIALAVTVAVVLFYYNTKTEMQNQEPQFQVDFEINNFSRSHGKSHHGPYFQYDCNVTISLANNVTLKNFAVMQWHEGLLKGTPPPHTALARSYYSYSQTLKAFSTWDGEQFTVTAKAIQRTANYNPRCSIGIRWDGGSQEFNYSPY